MKTPQMMAIMKASKLVLAVITVIIMYVLITNDEPSKWYYNTYAIIFIISYVTQYVLSKM
jgi:hypothetical protein